MHDRKYCNPYLFRPDAGLVALQPDRSETGRRDEKWYQKLVHENPKLLPVGEIEPAFDQLIPLARELQIGSGRVDIACINGSGLITLVETKLFRNPEARRAVVSQIIEYATGMAQWTYAELCQRVNRAREHELAGQLAKGTQTPCSDPILPLVQDTPGFDQSRFIDTVTKNLQKGRFLLLIAGDGIQQGVIDLTEVVQQSPHLGFTLALVELEVFKLPGAIGELFIQPRVLVRTTEIVRHLIEINVQNSPPIITVRSPRSKDPVQPVTMTETLYFEKIEQEAGKPVADFARWVRDKVNETPDLDVSFSKLGMGLWWKDESGEYSVKLIRLRPNGVFSATDGVSLFCQDEVLPDSVTAAYQTGLAKLVGNASRSEHGKKGRTAVKTRDGEWPPIEPLIANRDAFWQLIIETTRALEDAIEDKLKGAKPSH